MKKVKNIAGSLLAAGLLAVSGLQLNAQTNSAMMISVGAKGVLASADNKDAFLFVSLDKDMVAKDGVDGNSWYVISHLTSGKRSFDVLTHYIMIEMADGAPAYKATVTVSDPVSEKYTVEDR